MDDLYQIFRIKNFLVFCITAAFSIFAYIWLIIVLVWASPGKVEIWEAVLTFLFFPILVCTAYVADKGYFNKLLCQKGQEEADKPEQLELGESKNSTDSFLLKLFYTTLQVQRCWGTVRSKVLC